MPGSGLTYKSLLKLSGLPDTPETPIFGELCKTVKKHLKSQPHDSAGLAGPGHGLAGKGSKARMFHSFVVDYLDSGIGQKYWGPTTEGKWRLDRDRACIVRFFRDLVMYQAKLERKLRSNAGNRERKCDKCKEYEDDDSWEEQSGDEDDSFEESQLGSEDIESRDLSEGNLKKEDLMEQGLEVEELPPPSIQRRLDIYSKTAEAQNTANYISPPDNLTLTSPIRKRSLKSYSSYPSKRPRQSKSSSLGIAGSILETRHNGPGLKLTPNSSNERVFQTRLGDDETIVFLFARSTISFEQFLVEFCDGRKIDIADFCAENVRARISITDAGDYQLSFGPHRKKSWLHIMKVFDITWTIV